MTITHEEHVQHVKAFWMAAICYSFYTGSGIINKMMGELISVPAIMVLMAFFVLTNVVVLASGMRNLGLLRSANPKRQIIRSSINVAASYGNYMALVAMPIATSNVISYLIPLFMVVIAWLTLGERFGWRFIASFICGIGGAVLILGPEPTLWTPALFALLGIIAASANGVFVRTLPKDHPFAFSVYTCTVMLAATLPFCWREIMALPTHVWPWMFGSAFIATIANYLFFRAYQMAPTRIVSPTQYTSLLWAALAGWVIWNDVPTLVFWPGAALIIAAGWLTISRPKAPPKPVEVKPV